MPMDKKRYPTNWKEIAFEIKEKADWKCQKCGKQCRRPDEPFDTHKRTLTVAHLNHTPEDITSDNLKAMCAPCHLRYDAKHHAESRRKNREAVSTKGGSRRKMNSETAISILKNEKACVMRADKCGRDCAKCELVKPDNEILEALDMGIKAIRNGSLVDQIREFVKEENYLGKR